MVILEKSKPREEVEGEGVGDEVFDSFFDCFGGVGSEGGVDVLAAVVGFGVEDVVVTGDFGEVEAAAVTSKRG